jgi:hypothetical protein
VAGEDLLDQRRARPGQADDEDRGRARIAAAGMPGEERSIEEGADSCGASLEVLDVEGRVEAPQRVATGVVGEGLRVLPPLLEGPTECEVQLRAVSPVASSRSMAAISASPKL